MLPTLQNVKSTPKYHNHHTHQNSRYSTFYLMIAVCLAMQFKLTFIHFAQQKVTHSSPSVNLSQFGYYIILNRMTSIFSPTLLKGKLALISGGATGICYQIAKQFLLHGASVYIISRKIENINKAVKALAQETGNSNIWGSSCDVRKEIEIDATVKSIVEKHGDIHILVNGAAGNFLCPFQKLTPNAFRTVLMIDTVGTFLLSKYTVQYGMKNEGVIINITANLHYNGTILQAHAGTAKAGVDALTKHMAVELGPRNIRVVGVSPGPIEKTQGFQRLASGEVEGMQGIIPIQKVGQSKDIADSCLFLASSAARIITGITLLVDGGVNLTAPNFPFLSKTLAKEYPNFGKSKL